jgi:superoxide dismutase, Fe-Mn family
MTVRKDDRSLEQELVMDVAIQNLPFDPVGFDGLSEALLRSHHANNYSGAVRRLNAIRAQWGRLAAASAPVFEINGLKREELMATNSMLLHELYFAGLCKGGAAIPPPLAMALAGSFGSEARWRDEFVAMGKAQGGGSGWVLLSFQPREGTLVNQWAADHTHAVAGGLPILALDMYEHAYHMDYGAAAGRYVDAFMHHVDGGSLYLRYQQAVISASEAFAALPDDAAGALLLDVRRAAAYRQADAQLPGAGWRDPAEVDTWCAALPRDREVIVYCAHGQEVGRGTALRLRAAGIAARFLRGGFEGWRASGHPLEAKESTS